MESILVLTALLFVFHLVIIVYLYRSISAEGTDEKEDGISDSFERISDSISPSDPSNSSERKRNTSGMVPCQVCGVPNDPSFRFCRHCVSELSGSSSPYNGRPTGQPDK